VLSFCGLGLSWDNKVLLFLSESCFLDNKIAGSCHVIKSASFRCMGLSWEKRLPLSKENNFLLLYSIWILDQI
jgi:hypothetical protein